MLEILVHKGQNIFLILILKIFLREIVFINVFHELKTIDPVTSLNIIITTSEIILK